MQLLWENRTKSAIICASCSCWASTLVGELLLIDRNGGLFDKDITALCNFCKSKISGSPNDYLPVCSSGAGFLSMVQYIVIWPLKKSYECEVW